MKKLISVLFLGVLMTLNINAQEAPLTGPTTEYPTLEKKLSKSENDIQNPKKTAKTKFWTDRAKLMLDIYNVHLKYIGQGMSVMQVKLVFREPQQMEAFQGEDGAPREKHMYERINIIYNNGAVESWEETNKIHEDPLTVANEALLKADELDVDGKATEDIKELYDQLKKAALGQGVDYLLASKYDEAYDKFVLINKINETKHYEGVQDTIAYYYAGYSLHEKSKTVEGEEAVKLEEKALAEFKKAEDLGLTEAGLYVRMKEAYFVVGDSVKGEAALKKGFDLNPGSQYIVAELVNYYLFANKADEALEYVRIALADNPTQKDYMFTEAYLLDKSGKIDEAEAKYKNIIEVHPDYYNAYYNLGALYYNKTRELDLAANDIPLNKPKEYEEAKAKANEMLKSSLPYFEKALEIEPGDKSTLQTLKEIYNRLKMTDKYNEVNALLNQ